MDNCKILTKLIYLAFMSLSNEHNWRPTATLPALQARALMYSQIRQFFASRDILEVETPLLCSRSVTDPYIQPFTVENKYYLQTSPEYAMKRLLAAGYGSIYQICKAFRKEEAGSKHNPEFTMLEWYHIGFDDKQLIEELELLLQLLLSIQQPIKRVSYQELFLETIGINPHTTDLNSLKTYAHKHNIILSPEVIEKLNVTDWLQLLMSHIIESQLTGPVPWVIYDFPAAQAALARVIPTPYPAAARFEVYMQGIELANGYYELLDPKEHIQRFENDNNRRSELKLDRHQIDEKFIEALNFGMPKCSGVTLGLDRVLMHKLKVSSIEEVLSFSINNV